MLLGGLFHVDRSEPETEDNTRVRKARSFLPLEGGEFTLLPSFGITVKNNAEISAGNNQMLIMFTGFTLLCTHQISHYAQKPFIGKQ